jgi:hypothetical protein
MRTRLFRIMGLAIVTAALLGTFHGAQLVAATSCTSNSQCPTGTLCCYPCGTDGCHDECITPIDGHCPHYP